MTLRIQLDKNQYATLISAYEPTLDADDEVKEAFYTQLSQIMISTLERDKLIVLEDFNCQSGKRSRNMRAEVDGWLNFEEEKKQEQKLKDRGDWTVGTNLGLNYHQDWTTQFAKERSGSGWGPTVTTDNYINLVLH